MTKFFYQARLFFQKPFSVVLILFLGSFTTLSAHSLPDNSLATRLISTGAINPTMSNQPKDLQPIIAKLEAQIQEQIRKKRIPGCAVAIVYKNQIVYINGFGVRTLGKNEKIDANTIFQLGSVSKPIAATLISVLENKGLLRLEDPVTRYLPQFSLNTRQPPNALKVKHILSHSTGVSRAGFNQLIEAHTTFPQILKTIKNVPVRTPFGKRYDYNNATYSVISEITRSATHLSFAEALRVNLLAPLNMTRTSASYEGLLSSENRASPHTMSRKGLVPAGIYSSGYYAVAPAGGINSTVHDMAIFLKAQMGGYPQVLSLDAIQRIQVPQIGTKSMLQSVDGPSNLISHPSYALGWRIVDFADQKMVFHGGWLKGFTNFIGFVPRQNIGIVILHNGDSKFSSRLGVKFFEMFFDIPQKKSRKEMIVPMATKSTIKSKKLKNIKAYRNLQSAKKPKAKNAKAKVAKGTKAARAKTPKATTKAKTVNNKATTTLKKASLRPINATINVISKAPKTTNITPKSQKTLTFKRCTPKLVQAKPKVATKSPVKKTKNKQS